MAANEERAAGFSLVHSKQASASKTEFSIWMTISKWLFLKLMLLSNYRASCWCQTRFSSWDPMDHSQQAASPRALSHDTSFLVSKFCTYTRCSELFCHRHLTTFFFPLELHTHSKLLFLLLLKVPSFLFSFLCLNLINCCGKWGNVEENDVCFGHLALALCEKCTYCIRALQFTDRVIS